MHHQAHAGLFGAWAHTVSGGCEDVGEVGGGEGSCAVFVAAFDAGEGQDVARERVEARRFAAQHVHELVALVFGEGVAGSLQHVDDAEYSRERRLDLVRDVGDEVAAELGEAARLGEGELLGLAFARESAVAHHEAEGEQQHHQDSRRADEGGEYQNGTVGAQRRDYRLVGKGEAHDEIVARAAGAVEHPGGGGGGLAKGHAFAFLSCRGHFGA